MAKKIWAFGRPHTIIGSAISIVTLYSIICHRSLDTQLPLLFLALAIGICCNIFIVGINQIADVSIDRINKPYLPIASGELSIRHAKQIAYGSLLLSLSLALWISPWLFCIILLSAAIGWAYSMPPFYWKKHHLTAAFAIVFVRGILINIGGFLVINYEVNGLLYLPEDVKLLSVFIIVFSMVISWFKDLPDIEGDAIYRIRTLAIVYSPRFVFIAGNLLIISTFLISIFMLHARLNGAGQSHRVSVLFYGNCFLLLLFAVHMLTANLAKHAAIQKFYKRFWGFFFAEYLLYLAAYLCC
ncbi:MAG TPA: homogentisate phytyltransferase [Flavobacterium sp.]|nr:homogentisate phytyltransferase [Flavobacterium sp.]